MQFKRIADVLDAADYVGAGGQQRELLEYAIRLSVREYIQLSAEAGNDSFDVAKAVGELAKQEADFNEIRWD